METRLVRQCTAEFRVEKGYPKWLPETDTQEEPVIGSRYKRYKHKNRHKPIIDKVSSLNAISELYQITVSTEDPIATNSISVRCNWSARVRSLVAGSILDQIVGSNFSHRLRSQYQPAMLSSEPSQPIPLRHSPNFTTS